MPIVDAVAIYPKQSVQYLFITNKAPTVDEQKKMSQGAPSWENTPNLVALFDFKGTLLSTSISGLTSPLVGFSFYRRAKNESVMHHICDLPIMDGKVETLYDYMVANDHEYIYTVIPITETELGISFEGNPVKTNWDSWTIISLDENADGIYVADEIWRLRFDLNIGDFRMNTDVVVSEGYNKYPRVSVGEKRYITGSLSAKLSEINCVTMQLEDTIERLEAWKKFVSSGKKMLIKDTKGQIIIGMISDSTSYSYDNSLQGLPTTVSFNFVEVENCDDASVYRTVPPFDYQAMSQLYTLSSDGEIIMSPIEQYPVANARFSVMDDGNACVTYNDTHTNPGFSIVDGNLIAQFEDE